MDSDNWSDWSGMEEVMDTVCSEASPTKLQKNEQEDSQSDIDDGLPLAVLEERYKKSNQSTSEIDETEEPLSTLSDDSDSNADRDYMPSKDDINSSDSDNNFSDNQEHDAMSQTNLSLCQRKAAKKQLHFPQRKRQKVNRIQRKIRKKVVITKQRDAYLSRKLRLQIQNKIQSRKRAIHGSPESGAFKKMVEKSMRALKIRQILEKFHTQKVDKILASNGYKRITIKRDGNCLINAVLMQLENADLTSDEIRKQITTHIQQNVDHYANFIKFDINMEQKIAFVKQKAAALSQNGHWQSDFADFVPLCLANIIRRPLRIFSSRMFAPIFDVEPDLVEPITNDKILLAHLAFKSSEHYDAVTKSLCKENTSVNMTSERETTPQRPQASRECPTTPLLTPHEAAEYVSPKRKHLFRKRQCRPGEWKSNKRKRLKDQGKQYTSKTGKVVQAKSVKSKDCQKCRFKCPSKISEEERQDLFNLYWDLGEYNKQRSFICTNISITNPLRKNPNARKQRNKAYSFFFTVYGKRLRVCKDFFLKTLDIGKKTVDSAVNKMKHGIYAGIDGRGRKTPGNKTPKPDEDFVHKHINSFPVVDSHYTRKHTQRKYLASDLSINKMYTLYEEECRKNARKPVKSKFYRKIFTECYNLSFFKPKKDQCATCTIHDQQVVDGTMTPKMEFKYKEHQKRKESRNEKSRDKTRAQNDKSYHVSTFDLQAVLSVPCSMVGDLYYKRKLSCYNLSFYNLGNSSGQCFLWDETQGGRGSCEIGTCLSSYITSMGGQGSPVKELVLYSDTCGGQNRNQFVVAALHHTMTMLPNIEVISQKYFESGHSHMESDSMHSAIESAKKCTKIHVPSQWETVIHLARKTKPYLVVPMRYSDFNDYKELVKNQYRNMKVDINGHKINWQRLKWIQIRKKQPESIFCNYGFKDTDFHEVHWGTKLRRGRPTEAVYTLQKRYQAKLPISEAKKSDLLSLCQKGIIPEDCHQYYRNLPTSNSVGDKLPVPDLQESDQDTDAD